MERLATSQRGLLRGPGLDNVDFSINKDTRLPFLGEQGKSGVSSGDLQHPEPSEFRDAERHRVFRRGEGLRPILGSPEHECGGDHGNGGYVASNSACAEGRFLTGEMSKSGNSGAPDSKRIGSS